MKESERGFLLLTTKLGDPTRRPLTASQMGLLEQRCRSLPQEEGQLDRQHLLTLGLERSLVERILRLLDDEARLDAYLAKAACCGCIPVTRASSSYPRGLRQRMGTDAPGCLWVKGNPELFRFRAVSQVGSRDLMPKNREFSREVGFQAAKQRYVLVSGNARGADMTAQDACCDAGGWVLSVVADALDAHDPVGNRVYVCEGDFDEPFSAQRALSRNRVIHALGKMTFVAQCNLGRGGTWDGSLRNLRNRWSPLYCFRDESRASRELERMGATLICQEALADFSGLSVDTPSLF